MNKPVTYIWLILIFLAVSGLAFIIGSNFQAEFSCLVPEEMARPSSFNKKPSGYSAFFELCSLAGLQSKQWQSPYCLLENNQGTLFLVAPQYPLKDFEIEQILHWVEKGNKLVYLDYFAYGAGQRFLKRLGLSEISGKSIDHVSFKPDKKILAMAYVDKLVLSGQARLEGGQVLLKDDYGSLMVETVQGKGKCLVAVTPGMCANRFIAKKESKGNFQFLINWLQDTQGTVWFDEKCHGWRSGLNIFVLLARTPAGFVTLQLLIIFFVAFGSLNTRFGAAKKLAVRRPILDKDFIESMALTYGRARAHDVALTILYGAFKTRLGKTLGLTDVECRAFLDKANALLLNGCKNNEELIAFVNQLDKLSDALNGLRRSPLGLK